MNVNILFRGYRKDGKGWAKGVCVSDNPDNYNYRIIQSYEPYSVTKIATLDAPSVISDTIGFDTGLKDVYGEQIFTGDIVYFEKHPWNSIRHLEGVVAYNKEDCQLVVLTSNNESIPLNMYDSKFMELMGTIVDNTSYWSIYTSSFK